MIGDIIGYDIGDQSSVATALTSGVARCKPDATGVPPETGRATHSPVPGVRRATTLESPAGNHYSGRTGGEFEAAHSALSPEH